jgi:hypothetical protein
MAVIKFTDAVVTLNGTGGPPPTGGTALPHVRSVTIDYSAELQDVTEMGMTTKANLPSLLDWTVTVECVQDYASGNVDATLFPLVGAAEFYIQVKTQNTTVSTTNPQWYAKTVLESYGPVTGSVGDAQIVQAVFRPGTSVTTNVLTRSVT